jgi:hypothetical protein
MQLLTDMRAGRKRGTMFVRERPPFAIWLQVAGTHRAWEAPRPELAASMEQVRWPTPAMPSGSPIVAILVAVQRGSSCELVSL